MRKSLHKKKKTFNTVKVFVIPTTAIVLLLIFIFLIKGVLGNNNLTTKIESIDITNLWNSGDYDRIIELTEIQLDKDPLDPIALIYCGFSYFYKGVSQISNEKKIPYINKSIFLLRKALILDDVPMRSRIHYILGKAYLHKDYYYSDLAVFYLKKSIDEDFINDDSYEYIGQAYSLLGDYENSLVNYLKAVENNPTDLLYLKISEDYIENRMYDKGEMYLKLMIENTKDEMLKKKGLFKLANLYCDLKNYSRAEPVLKELVEYEQGNENYHFLLGEVFFFTGNKAEARSEWFKTTRINPKHVGALLRLYG